MQKVPLDRNKKKNNMRWSTECLNRSKRSYEAVGYVACLLGGAVLCYLLLSLGVVDAVDGLPGTMQEPAIAMPTYLGFMSAMMTAVTAVLAAVAIGIGVVTFFTFGGIKLKPGRSPVSG